MTVDKLKVMPVDNLLLKRERVRRFILEWNNA